jgi:xanthine/CO dehydrogenase XdhC/CoxF family maturation factor
MMERRQVVTLWRGGHGGVLVTLVRAEGSSYRRPGARLLTGLADGAGYAGTISGGCLESEVVRKAEWLVRSGAVVERYSMLFDDTAEIPFGLGCGGVVDLLFESVTSAEGQALLTAMEASLSGQESTVVSFLPGRGRGLRRLLLDRDGAVVFSSAGLSAEKIACARGLVPGEEYEGRFVERLAAPHRLVILGAGDDARPLAAMAAQLGWTVVVADGRAQLARPERFPEAELVLAAGPGLELRAQDAIVIMTHSYEQDRAWLTASLAVGPRYLGLLGSRHRSSLLVSEAAELLGRPLAWCCGQIFAPVGLDLGGDGPQAIALAIVAEAHAVCSGRMAVRDRMTVAEVERQLAKGGATQYLQAKCALDVAL